MPVADKVNAALPVSAEVRVAQERLAALLKQEPDALKAVEEQVDARMVLRALNCTKNVKIGRLASVAEVQQLVTDRSCFQEQDNELLQFYGIRTVGLLLARPPLRPLKPAGQLTPLAHPKFERFDVGAIARDAGVAYLQGPLGNGVIVELPGAAPIATIDRSMGWGHLGTRLSPNGRLLVGNEGQSSVFYDAETGSNCWEAPRSMRLLEWLPHVNGLLMTNASGGVSLLDGTRGTSIEEPLAPKNSNYAAATPGNEPGSTPRTLVGTNNSFVLLEHARTAAGLTSTAHKQFQIPYSGGISIGPPVSMRSGQSVIFVTSRDIGWLDLGSGASGVWKTSGFFQPVFSKLSETRIVLNSVGPRGFPRVWAFDIDALTVAPLELGDFPGTILSIGDRVGFLLREKSLSFGDKADAGAAEPMEKVVARAELEQQLAKLQALSQAADPSQGVNPAMNRLGLPASMVGISAPPVSGTATPAIPIVPGLEGLPKDAQVHIVGVYEGKRPSGSPAADRRQPVRVVVRGTGHPMILVLAGYEPVTWQVANTGARIVAVLLSGDASSSVAGAGSVPILRIGHHFAYKAEGEEYQALRLAVARYTGSAPIRSFQGAYTGSDFSLGGY